MLTSPIKRKVFLMTHGVLKQYTAQIQIVILFLLVAIFLIPGMYNNYYSVSPASTFKNAGRGSEFIMAGRLVYARDHGIFSTGGIPGSIGPPPEGMSVFDFQYEAYIHGLPYENVNPHKSQLGFQALPYIIISKITGVSGEKGLNTFWLMNSVLMGLVVLLLSLWARYHFGFFSAILILLSVFLSIWFNALGRNLWFVFWVHYLPFLFVCYVLYREMKGFRLNLVWLGVFFYFLVLFRMLMTSFEFATSSLFMPLVPLVFYAVYKKWSLRTFIIRFSGISVISFLAVISAMLILAFQISKIDGSFRDGVDFIRYSYNKRADGDPEKYSHNTLLYKSLKASRSEVLQIYWKKEAMDLGFYNRDKGSPKIMTRVNYGHIVVFFIGMTFLGLILHRKKAKNPDARRMLLSIIITTWLSVIGPLSWFLIFKGHAYIHRGLDMIVWHMPFVFFGFMMTGYILTYMFHRNFLIRGKTRG